MVRFFVSFLAYNAPVKEQNNNNFRQLSGLLVSTAASCLVRSTPDRAVRVRTLTGNTLLCFWARHFTLTLPLSIQMCNWASSLSSGSRNTAIDALCCIKTGDKRWPEEPLSSYLNFTFT